MGRLLVEIRFGILAFGHVGRRVLQRFYQDRGRIEWLPVLLLREKGSGGEREARRDAII